MNELTLEVLFAVIALIAVAGSELVEMHLSPTLSKYNVSDEDVRKGIFIGASAIVNIAMIYVLDVDVVADLIKENSTLVTVALSAFAASGFGETYHKFKGLIGKKTILEIARDTVAVIENEQKSE